MAKIKITQIVSRIGSTARQKRNLDALGIKKLNRSVVHEDSNIIKGMIEKVRHLVKVEAATEADLKPKAAKAAPTKKVVAAPKVAAPKTSAAEKPAVKKPVAEKKAAAPKKPVATKTAAEKKPVAKKPATAKTAAPKKPTAPKKVKE